MKKFIFTLTLFCTIVVLYAQEDEAFGFQKGDFIISGSINYHTSNANSEYLNDGELNQYENKSNDLSLNPEVSYFINKNIALGLRTGYFLFQVRR
ncbi:hypothetical protein [Aquimarina brevivitae]|uniref:hypothetical protein n=1 Tax=Aquimarina brevivitae TaxID=323412 RepID=UPI0010290570|nr:hypothetical protein [Aquimarina brevivitae]